MKPEELVEQYFSMHRPERRQHLASLEEADLAKILHLAAGDNGRSATRILADYGSRGAAFIKKHENETLLLLNNSDPKVRMNAAELIGATIAADHVDDLAAALDREETMYVRPSLLLAIGSAKNAAAENYLRNYSIRSDLEKHIMEERQALTKALANFVKKETPHVRILPTDILMVSTPNVGVTLDAFARAGMKAKKFGAYVAVSGLKNFYDIYRVRAYITAYIYLGSSEIDKVPELLASREKAIFQRTHVKGFRLEVQNVSHEERLKIIRKCLEKIELLENTPSNYSVEVLIDVTDNKARLFLDPLVDPRYSYRRKSVPASINPGVAACVVSYASDYFSGDARVLDDFCGAGTLLFERGYYPYYTLTGVDINVKAIEAAKENSIYAQVHPQFHLVDALKFTAKRYSEVLTNMPFGHRVGSHEANERLYDRYFHVLPDILTDHGIAVLYTHEKRLTEKLIDASEALEPLKRTTFDAGGLYPAVYVLRRRHRGETG